MRLDDWQREILAYKGNKLLCSGRQTGKSTIISIDAGNYACLNANKSVLIISSTERQAEELFNKILYYIQDNYRALILKGKERPTKHLLKLRNGSIIRCLPTGLAGTGIRGFTIHRLIADEAAFIPDDVWSAVTPMLLTTGGDIILVSTPFGRQGYFWDRYNDPSFKIFHVNSEEVITKREISPSWTESQRKSALEHLEREKKRMTSLQYAQEYLGQFVSDLRQFFNDELIKKCMNLKRRERLIGNYYLGVDVARLGEDETTYEILDKVNKETYEHVDNIIGKKQRINEIVKNILDLDKIYKFKKIYIDDGGVGGGVFDYVLAEDQTKRKVIAINNSSRPLEMKTDKEPHKKKILKEDLYNNLLMLMEQGRIKLLDDDEVFASLKSVQYEYMLKEDEPTRLRIFGNYTHIVEGLIRAAWSSQDKTLNIWCAF
jgi:hypothetical protein